MPLLKLAFPLIVATAISLSAQTLPKLKYPTPPKSDQTDNYHGVRIADPYRTLENADAPTTGKWVDEENRLTFSWLGKIPGRDAIKSRLTSLWNYERFGGLYKAGNRYFYSHNTGLQNQSIHYVMDSLNGTPRELLDPNTYRQDGTAALNGESVSWDGKLFAYGVAQAGSDWEEWRIRNIDTGKDMPDVLRWCKSTNIAWTADNRAFYYSRYPEPPADQVLTVAALNQKVYFHKLGDPQSSDRLVYERPDHPDWGLNADVTEDGRYLLLYAYTGVPGKNMLSYVALNPQGGKVVDLIPTPDFSYSVVGNADSIFYVQTTNGAQRARIVAIDLKNPRKENWKEIVPQREETLDGAQLADGKLLLEYMKDAHSVARLVSLRGDFVSEIQLPGIGTASWSPARMHDREMFYAFTGYTIPPSVYRLDLATGRSSLVRQSKVAFAPSDFETKQVFYNSKDGTRVPMFLSYRKGLKLDGKNPTLLYAYGGFDISLTPQFDPSVVEWMRMGGIYAVANLRGGSEYGEAWHEAGMRAKKQNVFDDFIAAAEWLIANNYTSTPKLAIFGGSNGGLLVGAVLNQRPDLFGAAMPAVGVMDMLRFQKFGFGTQWVGEYGNPDNAEDFKLLRAYSPLHTIRKGTKYPPVLITTSDHDDRVMPGHSLKYAATLQQAQEGPAPILIRIETRAGHGAGKPTSKRIDEWADRLAFLQSALGM